MTPKPLHVERTGEGPTVLLMHGAGEDSSLLAPQAAALAERGFTAITYDRRGTGHSTHDDWPGGGMPRHVADAADLIRAEIGGPTRVLGFSSGGVVALALAVAHPELVVEVVAWEPPVISVLPEADGLHAMIMEPTHAYLAAHPADWAGAYDVLLATISDGQADLGSPLVAAMRCNAEAAVRDDAEVITRHRFTAHELAAAPAVIAVGAAPSDLQVLVSDRLGKLTGRGVWEVDAADDHEVYLQRPEVLAEAVARRSGAEVG